jgi:predicted aspartyl protease
MRAAHLLGGLLFILLPSLAVLAPAASEPHDPPGFAGCRALSARPVALEMANGLALVALLANGAPLKLILDTGAERTVLTVSAAERVGGQAPKIQFHRGLNGVGGVLPSQEVEFRSLAIGGVDIPWRRARVMRTELPGSFATVDGVLGGDVLSRFDIDLDLPNRRMSLYGRGTCAPDWAGRNAEIRIGRSAATGHLFFPVRLDNHKITATLDTGAQRTTLAVATARAMGLSDDMLARDPSLQTRGFGRGKLPSRLHRFDSLAVGTVGLSNPEIVVTDLRLRGIDLIIGMDILRSRRLFLSYSGSRLFLSNQAAASR